MIKISQLYKTYNTNNNANSSVLTNINLDIKAGEIFGIIGKSGAGKSTLIRCLNLLEQPTSGSILINNINLAQIPSRQLRLARHQIGMIFQGFNLLHSKNVFHNIALPLILQGNHSRVQIRNRVNELLELVNLTNVAKQYPSHLSGGQKQRVGIARALATNPQVLLSDEATSSLDSDTTNSILKLLSDINHKLGITIVLITHEIDVIKKVCDRVAVIDNGQIVEINDTIQMILHPQHPVTRKLIIEDEVQYYLEQVKDFYRFTPNKNSTLIILSLIGAQTFDPIISQLGQHTGLSVNILRGELGLIKNTPVGQMILALHGTEEQLHHGFQRLNELKLHYSTLSNEYYAK